MLDHPEDTQLASWRGRLRSPAQWKTTAYDTVVWFLLALLVIQMVRLVMPGYPIMVRTPSIQQGVYWLDRTAASFSRGDYASFEFRPVQEELKRYGFDGLRHTKRIVAVSGDTVIVDPQGKISVCSSGARVDECVPHGVVQPRDSIGRVMHSWVPLGTSYTLKDGENWVMGEHPRSLDSRYHGPIVTGALLGRAHLLVAWGG